jgi:hypothetical protein
MEPTKLGWWRFQILSDDLIISLSHPLLAVGDGLAAILAQHQGLADGMGIQQPTAAMGRLGWEMFLSFLLPCHLLCFACGVGGHQEMGIFIRSCMASSAVQYSMR